MNEVVKSDVFFFITSVAVVAVSVMVAVALVYLIRILRDVRRLSKLVREEGESIMDDVSHAHKGARKYILRFLRGKKKHK